MLSLLTPISLLSDEQVIFRTKRHWIIFFVPVLYLLLAIFFMTNNAITETIKNGFVLMFQNSGHPFIARQIPLIFLLFASVFTSVQQWLNYATSDFVITTKRVLMRQGFFTRYVRDMRISTITLVSVQQDIIGQIVDYGSIVIQSFGANDFFEKIAQPKKFQFYLQEEIDKVGRGR